MNLFISLPTTYLDVPEAPYDVKVAEIGGDWVRLEWRSPKYNGGCVVSGYIVEKRDTSFDNFWTTATTTTATQTGATIRG